MPELTEELANERMWIEASRKDTASFRPLYEKYYESLFRFFLRRTDDEMLAEDLCSSTFYKALDGLGRYVWQGKPFGAWLFKIGSNELKRHFRDKKPIFVIEEDRLDCLSDIEAIVEPNHLEKLIAVLDELPEIELRLLELKYFEGTNFRDISVLLGLGESAVKMRLYRLLARLKTLILQGHDEA